MPTRPEDKPLRQEASPRRRHEESQTMLAIMMAGIAALFIAGIVAAFLYAKDTNPVVQAQGLQDAPPAQTTGSGGRP